MNITIVKGRLTRLTAFMAKCATAGITGNQFLFLSHVHRTPGSGTTALAEALGISTAAVTEIFQLLRKRGLVSKTYSTTDERRIIYQLTEQGTELLAALSN